MSQSNPQNPASSEKLGYDGTPSQQDSKLASKNHQEQYQEQLNSDYSTIAALLSDLNEQSAQFSNQMELILDRVPAQEGLATLWQEQANALERENGNHAKRGNQKNSLEKRAAQEKEDEDKIILL